MELTDEQLEHFDSKVLALKPEKEEGFIRQVDYLITQLQKKIDEDSAFRVIGFEKTGSLIKGTVLHPKGDDGVDADIAVFLDISEAEREDVSLLHSIILDLLLKVYPSKYKEDFKIQPKTLGIHFHVSGLDVDLVPVIPIPEESGYCWQPSSDGGAPVKTNILGHLKFIEQRDAKDPRFKQIVRILKRWRNYQELDRLKSFAIELIVSYLQDIKGPVTSLESGLKRFFLYIAQSKLQGLIMFAENNGVNPGCSDPVVILDPVNPNNNVTNRITPSERDEIVNAAQVAWETIEAASWKSGKGETIELWKEVFGRSFVIED